MTHSHTLDAVSDEVDEVDVETAIGNMMAQAADSDLGHPWAAVQEALETLDPESRAEVFGALHGALLAKGYEPAVVL